MRNLWLCLALIAALSLCNGVVSAQTTGAVTATCKDGTAFTGTKRSGACRGHGGVQSWGEPTTPTSAPTQSAPASQAAPSGAAGQVWVNSASKVYHCHGTRWYGKTKHGSYMSEAQAQAGGARPDHGKTCSS